MNVKLYGTIEGHNKISFVLDNFQCVFINSDMNSKTSEEIEAFQGFIVGKTTENKYVYIYSGKNLRIWNQQTLNTWIYFVSKSDKISSFDTISFHGGILNKLFFKSSLEFEDYNPMKPIYNDDCKKYLLTNEKVKGELSIRSVVGADYSAEKGNHLIVMGTELQVTFSDKKDLTFISEIFGYILNLCQFLAFRKNLGFEKVVLGNRSQEYPEFSDASADCFVRYDEERETQKKIVNCITFNDIGDGMNQLLCAIVNNKPKKPQFNIGFIPENDKDVNVVTSMKIREVCSALESEMELAEITVDQEEEFVILIKKMKEIVKAHRDGEKPLTDTKVYEYIFGTLNNLKGALADRIEKCFMLHQQEIGEYVSREQIDAIVKYRNTITHGNYMQLNQELADTMYILIQLVYCCVLQRIGMQSEDIRILMNRRIIS